MAARMTRLRADLILLACAAIWGFAFLFQKSAMLHVGPFLFIAARSLVACIALAPLTLRERRGRTLPGWKEIATAALPAGAAFFLGAAFQQVGLVTATVTNTGFLTALYVVFTPMVAWVLMGRVPQPLVWLAVVISFLGTWLLGGGGIGAFSRGDALVAISAMFWALHVVLLGRAARLESPMSFTGLQFAVVGLLALAAAFALEEVRFSALAAAAVEIGYVGLLSSALTFTLFAMALRWTQPTEAAIIVSTETLFAAFGAWLILGERLPLVGWLGAVAILGAILLVQLIPSRHRESPETSRSATVGSPAERQSP